jgi:hypothetical protein
MNVETVRLTALEHAMNMRQPHETAEDVLATATKFEAWLYSGGDRPVPVTDAALRGPDPHVSVTFPPPNGMDHVLDYTT